MATQTRQPGDDSSNNVCQYHYGLVVSLENYEAKLEKAEKEHVQMWQKFSSKMSRVMFMWVVGGLIVLSLAVFSFQWSAFGKHQNAVKELNDGINIKMQQMSEDLVEIKTLIKRGNGN